VVVYGTIWWKLYYTFKITYLLPHCDEDYHKVNQNAKISQCLIITEHGSLKTTRAFHSFYPFVLIYRESYGTRSYKTWPGNGEFSFSCIKNVFMLHCTNYKSKIWQTHFLLQWFWAICTLFLVILCFLSHLHSTSL